MWLNLSLGHINCCFFDYFNLYFLSIFLNVFRKNFFFFRKEKLNSYKSDLKENSEVYLIAKTGGEMFCIKTGFLS